LSFKFQILRYFVAHKNTHLVVRSQYLIFKDEQGNLVDIRHKLSIIYKA